MCKLLFGCGTNKDNAGRTWPSLAETSKINAVTSKIIAFAATQVMNPSFWLFLLTIYRHTLPCQMALIGLNPLVTSFMTTSTTQCSNGWATRKTHISQPHLTFWISKSFASLNSCSFSGRQLFWPHSSPKMQMRPSPYQTCWRWWLYMHAKTACLWGGAFTCSAPNCFLPW